LIVFPAGEVSHINCRRGRITDPAWSQHVASLARMSGADVLPVFFPGRNSLLFNLLGLVHPRLRTIMLAREMLARQSTRIKLFMGRRISYNRLKTFNNDKNLIRWLRFNTYFLANRLPRDNHLYRVFAKHTKTEIKPLKLIPPVSSSLLAAEAAALPERSRLITHKQLTVFIADSDQIPHMLREIGRLREKTFREVGEGTGNAMDVDLFDSYYRHLVLWNSKPAEVVGAYRIGDTAAILGRFGRKGLYTHSLFRFKRGLMRHLPHSLELGRSFIRSEYQRHPNCLALLWKAIGEYLVRHPEHRILFGPVSISNSYQRLSKQLMIQFLKRNCSSRKLSAYVSPRCPFRMLPGQPLDDRNQQLAAGSIDDVSMLISEIEGDGKRVPVLIKHYLKLNGQFIAFNVDRDFCNAVDGLVVVDLMKTKIKLLERFMGPEGAESYLEYWSGKRFLEWNEGDSSPSVINERPLGFYQLSWPRKATGRRWKS
jgi:putative hemolysin